MNYESVTNRHSMMAVWKLARYLHYSLDRSTHGFYERKDSDYISLATN
jgi:hypothetical protein